jgi:DNA-binding NtrC family response regulator
VLVVEDDVELCQEICETARGWGVEVSEATSLEQAVGLLERDPDVVIADLWLEGASAIPLLRAAAHRRPSPVIVAMSGQASQEETFELGRLNVRAYLPKPFSAERLHDAVRAAIGEPPDVDPWIADLVGYESLKDVIGTVRSTMLAQALAQTGGSRSAAARLLRVSRQAIQQVLQRERRGSRSSVLRGSEPPRKPPAQSPPPAP